MAELDCCVYLINADSETEYGNEISAMNCGYDSPVSQRGRSPFDCFIKDTAIKVINDHNIAMKSSSLKIIEDDVLNRDGSVNHFLTMLWPKYNYNNSLTGILGCSINVGHHPLPKILATLTQLNLMCSHNNLAKGNGIIKDVLNNVDFHLSLRERECVELILLGRSSKYIGKLLNLSHRTVDNYISNIKSKFNVSTRQQLIDMILSFSPGKQ